MMVSYINLVLTKVMIPWDMVINNSRSTTNTNKKGDNSIKKGKITQYTTVRLKLCKLAKLI
jgi:hypothetical protein